MSDEEYNKAMLRIQELWEAEPNTPEGEELEKLVELVSKYEEENFF